MYETIRGQEYSGAGVPHLNLKIIGNIRIPIPPIEEQRAIVADLDRKAMVVSGLKTLASDAEERVKQLVNAIWEH